MKKDIKLNSKIVERNINELHPHSGAHNTSGAINMLQESLLKYGFQQPIVIDKDDNIASGNGIYEAAKLLGIEKVPCISVEYLSDEEVAQYRIADNKTAEFARWNEDKLKKEISYLQSPNELQFCFDDDLQKMIASNPIPVQVASPVNVVQATQNKPIDMEAENSRGDKPTQNIRETVEKDMEVKPTEYFEYTCSACGRKITFRL